MTDFSMDTMTSEKAGCPQSLDMTKTKNTTQYDRHDNENSNDFRTRHFIFH